jgi:hypothetical protein
MNIKTISLQKKSEIKLLKKEALKLLRFINERAIEKNQPLSVAEKNHLKKTFLTACNAHQNHYRKNGRLYLWHMIGVVDRLVKHFDVTNPLFIEIALLHDTDEDQPEEYKKVKKFLNSLTTETTYDHLGPNFWFPQIFGKNVHVQLIYLGVDLLTKPKETGRGNREKHKESIRTYFSKLAFPWWIFPMSTLPASYQFISDFLRGIHQIKLADRLDNLNDFSILYERAKTPPTRFSKKTIIGTFDFFIPLFVERSPFLTKSDKEIFYRRFREKLNRYSTLKEDRYSPLKKQAIKALELLDKLGK